MAKINVSFPEGFLGQLDRLTREEHITRSELLRKAVKLYMDAWNQKKAEEKRQKGIMEAMKIQDALRKKSGKWDGVSELRKWRKR